MKIGTKVLTVASCFATTVIVVFLMSVIRVIGGETPFQFLVNWMREGGDVCRAIYDGVKEVAFYASILASILGMIWFFHDFKKPASEKIKWVILAYFLFSLMTAAVMVTAVVTAKTAGNIDWWTVVFDESKNITSIIFLLCAIGTVVYIISMLISASVDRYREKRHKRIHGRVNGSD
ncbi:MAG: hypothetical protein PHP35_01370 [Candidatus Colwellbacteria bacterium]|nr:hypothetical protein [Candidatus Colwellbacteria bacterium]